MPLFFQLDDYRGCNHHNYNLTLNSSSSSSSSSSSMETVLASIPLFTLCRPTDCSHGFPSPTCKHYKNLLLVNESTWEQRMVNWSLVYPKWSDKIPKVVWRGGCIGRDKDHRRVLTQKSYIVKNRFLCVASGGKAIPLAPKIP